MSHKPREFPRKIQRIPGLQTERHRHGRQPSHRARSGDLSGPKSLAFDAGLRLEDSNQLKSTVTTFLKVNLSLNRSRTLVLLSYVNLWNFKLCSWSGIAVGNSCWKMERMPNPKCLDFTGDFCAKDLHCLVRSLSSILARYAWENLRCSGGMLNYRKLETAIYWSILSLCYILLEELDGKI